MKYEISSDGPKTTVHLQDEFSSADRREFDSLMSRVIADGTAEVDVDLRGLHYMDSVGLGLLITFGSRIGEAQGRFQVSHPEGVVKELLDLSRFDHLFPVRH